MSINNAAAFNQTGSVAPSLSSSMNLGGSVVGSDPSTGPPLTSEEWQARVTRFYAHYNPACISTVETIMAKYQGNEPALMRVLIKRWGPEPQNNNASNSTSSPSPPNAGNARSESSAATSASSPLIQNNNTTISKNNNNNDDASPTTSIASSAASPPKAQTSIPPPVPTALRGSVSSTAMPTLPNSAVSTTFPSNNNNNNNNPPFISDTASTSSTSTISGSKMPPPDDPKWRAIIEAFLKKYAVAQLPALDEIMSRAQGKEKEMLVHLQKKFQSQQQQASAGAATSSTTPPTTKPPTPTQGRSHSDSISSQQANAVTTNNNQNRLSVSSSTPTPPGSISATNNNSSNNNRPSAPPPSPGYTTSSESFYRRRVVRIYQHYRPDKLSEIDKILADPKYANRDYLISVLSKKYGPEPMSQPLPAEGWQAPTAGLAYPGASTIIPWPVRFFYMFLRYNPAQIPDLPKKIEANAGHEGRWMSVLCREFGGVDEPEPPVNYDEDPDVENNPHVANFVQKLSSVFSQFSPAMLPVVRAMAKEPSMLPRLEEIVSAARDYYLASLDPTSGVGSPRGGQQQNYFQERPYSSPNRLQNLPTSSSSYNNNNNNNNNNNFGSFRQNNVNNNNNNNNSAVGSPVLNSHSSSSRYFLDDQNQYFSTPRDLVQQAVDLVQQNKLLLQLQEPTDGDLINRASSFKNNNNSNFGSFRNNNNKPPSSALYQEASSLLQQAPYENNPNNANSTKKLKSHNSAGRSSSTNSASGGYGGSALTMELRAKNQQLEEMVTQLTTALDLKTSELRDAVGSRSTSTAGSSVQFVTEKNAATTQTFNKPRMTHATQTAALITSDGPASSVEEELENVKSNLGVREHQNRMLRLQLQQYAQELEQKEHQLRNSLSCVDSLTETVNMRMRENASLKLDQIPTSDSHRFLEVVDEIRQTFQLHYQESKERDEREMSEYYTLANQMIKHRDESIQELTKALDAALIERKKLVNAMMTTSVLETDGEVFLDSNSSPTSRRGAAAASSPSSLTNNNNPAPTTHANSAAAGTTIAQKTHFEKKISRLEKELARAHAQIQAQNEEHSTLVHALALYSSGNNTARESASGGSITTTTLAANNNNNNTSRTGSMISAVSRTNSAFAAAGDADPFTALLNARQRNASELPTSGVSKDEHLSKIEQLDAARLEAESAKAALAAELHRRSIALEDNEKHRVSVERDLERMQSEMHVAHQELTYWRNEADARKKDVNRLVEHVATLSDALQKQKEKISSGNYLLAHARDNNSNINNNNNSNYQGEMGGGSPNYNPAYMTNQTLYNFTEAPDESEPERKMVSTIRLPSTTNQNISSNFNNNPNSRAASLSLARQQWNTQNQNNLMNTTNNNNNFSPQPNIAARQQPQQQKQQNLNKDSNNNSNFTKSSLWSMMYGDDQQIVDRAEEVNPYPSKGYHMEGNPIFGGNNLRSQSTISQNVPPGPMIQNALVNTYFGNNNNNASTPKTSSNVQQGFLNYSKNNNNSDGYKVPKHLELNNTNNNVTAAASVAIARANIASTTGGIY